MRQSANTTARRRSSPFRPATSCFATCSASNPVAVAFRAIPSIATGDSSNSAGEKLPPSHPCHFHKGMEKTCSACGQLFQPAFVFQIAVTSDGQKNHFCSLECRKTGLGEEGFRAKRARRIAILNQKGGTGKTTTAVNLAAGLAEREHETLLIDTDAQGNVGVSLGVAGEKSLYHVLVEGVEPTEAAVPVRNHLEVLT